MITKNIVERLPEYKNVIVELPNFVKLDTPINSLDYVKENDLFSQILGIDPNTGFPRCDLTVINDVNTNEETRQYLIRCLRSVPSLSHPELDDDALFDLVKNKFENMSDYVQRINEKYIQPFEDVSAQ